MKIPSFGGLKKAFPVPLATATLLIARFGLIGGMWLLTVHGMGLFIAFADLNEGISGLMVCTCLFLTAACVLLVDSVLLMVSVYQRLPQAAVPWLVSTAFFLFAQVVAFICWICIGLVDKEILIPASTSIVFTAVSWRTVFAYWKQLRLVKNQENPDMDRGTKRRNVVSIP